MKYILITILVIILIFILIKNKETFSTNNYLIYNSEDEEATKKSFKTALNLKERLSETINKTDDFNKLNTLENNFKTKTNAKMLEITQKLNDNVKGAIKPYFIEHEESKKLIKGDKGLVGESGVSTLSTDLNAKQVKIDDAIVLNRTHLNDINDYYNGDLKKLNINNIDVRQQKDTVNTVLMDGSLYTDELKIGTDLNNPDNNLSIRNEMDALQIDKLNTQSMNIGNYTINSSSNNINIDDVEIDTLNVKNELKVNNKSILDIIKGPKGSKGPRGDKSELPKSAKISDNKLKLIYDDGSVIDILGEFKELKGLKGPKGDRGKRGITGDPFKLPNDIIINNNDIIFIFDQLSFKTSGVRGNKGLRGDKGATGERGDHGLYPIHAEFNKNTKQIIFHLDDKPKSTNFNVNNNLQKLYYTVNMNDFRGKIGDTGIKGDNGVNMYPGAFTFDNNNSNNNDRLTIHKNITFDDNVDVFIESDKVDIESLEKNNTYIFSLAKYLGISQKKNYNLDSTNFNLQRQIKEELTAEIKTIINKLFGEDINIYDFYYKKVTKEGKKYDVKYIIDIARLLNISILNKTMEEILNEINTLGKEFTGMDNFFNTLNKIEENKEFIYNYKVSSEVYGNFLYYNPEDLKVQEMSKAFNDINKVVEIILKTRFSKIPNKKIMNIIHKRYNLQDFILQMNNLFGNKFPYKKVGSKYSSLTSDEIIEKINNEFNLFKLNLPQVDYTLFEKLYILENFKLGHKTSCNNAEKCKKYCRERYDKLDQPNFSSSDFTCDSPISASKTITCPGNPSNENTYSYSIIPNPITNIYPTLNDLTNDAIFEINANKQNFLEDKLIVDFKSRMIFKMKNSNNEIIDDIRTKELKTFDRLNYWNLDGNYLETDVNKYKLTHDTKKLSGYTQIFVLRLSSFNNVKLVNYTDKNGNETAINPLVINENKFSYNNNNIQEYKISKCRSIDRMEEKVVCTRIVDNGNDWFYQEIKPEHIEDLKYLEPGRSEPVTYPDGQIVEIPNLYSATDLGSKHDFVIKALPEELRGKEHEQCYKYILRNLPTYEYKPLPPDSIYKKIVEVPIYNYSDDCSNAESYEDRPPDPIGDNFNDKWVFLAVKFKGDENIEDCNENTRDPKEEPFKKTEIYLNSLEHKLVNEVEPMDMIMEQDQSIPKTIKPIIDSPNSLDYEPLYYHTINKLQDSSPKGLNGEPDMMNRFDLSMMFSFNKALSNERINQIYEKIKEDYFINRDFTHQIHGHRVRRHQGHQEPDKLHQELSSINYK